LGREGKGFSQVAETSWGSNSVIEKEKTDGKKGGRG